MPTKAKPQPKTTKPKPVWAGPTEHADALMPTHVLVMKLTPTDAPAPTEPTPLHSPTDPIDEVEVLEMTPAE